MITEFKLFEIKTQNYNGETYIHSNEYSENLNDVILFINEDNSITNEWKNAVINAINTLPNEYKEKVYASRIIYHLDYDDNDTIIKKGDKLLNNVGISDVGKYWNNSDLPFLVEHLIKYNLDLNYSHTYHYIIIKSGKNLNKYYNTIMKKYNL